MLQPAGKFYATFDQAPYPIHLIPVVYKPGDVKTYYDLDPFHNSYEEILVLAENAGLAIELVEGWQKPSVSKNDLL